MVNETKGRESEYLNNPVTMRQENRINERDCFVDTKTHYNDGKPDGSQCIADRGNRKQEDKRMREEEKRMLE